MANPKKYVSAEIPNGDQVIIEVETERGWLVEEDDGMVLLDLKTHTYYDHRGQEWYEAEDRDDDWTLVEDAATIAKLEEVENR